MAENPVGGEKADCVLRVEREGQKSSVKDAISPDSEVECEI